MEAKILHTYTVKNQAILELRAVATETELVGVLLYSPIVNEPVKLCSPGDDLRDTLRDVFNVDPDLGLMKVSAYKEELARKLHFATVARDALVESLVGIAVAHDARPTVEGKVVVTLSMHEAMDLATFIAGCRKD